MIETETPDPPDEDEPEEEEDEEEVQEEAPRQDASVTLGNVNAGVRVHGVGG